MVFLSLYLKKPFFTINIYRKNKYINYVIKIQ